MKLRKLSKRRSKSRPQHQARRRARARSQNCSRCQFEHLSEGLQLRILAHPEKYPKVKMNHTCGKERSEGEEQ